MSDSPAPPQGTRELPGRRKGAPPSGARRRRYLRWKRIASIAALVTATALVVLVLGLFRGPSEDPDVSATKALLEDLARALTAHHAREGRLPRHIAELVNPSSPYRGSAVPEDAWRRLIEYRVLDAEAGRYRLRSLGPDGRPDTADDLVWPSGTNWP